MLNREHWNWCLINICWNTVGTGTLHGKRQIKIVSGLLLGERHNFILWEEPRCVTIQNSVVLVFHLYLFRCSNGTSIFWNRFQQFSIHGELGF